MLYNCAHWARMIQILWLLGASLHAGDESWTWKDTEGRVRSRAELDEILAAHRKWLGRDPRLPRTDIGRANLTGANLNRAKLSGAVLAGANLTRVVLVEADLKGASLGANLSHAILFDADLRGANLTRACLYQANLDHA